MTLTLANRLTMARIALIPPIALLVMIGEPATGWVALALFAGAAVTDYFDGVVARARGEITMLGRCLDPIADKLLVATVLLTLLAADRAPLLPVLVIVLRELVISGLREVLAGHGPALPVTRLAKWKTTAQMVALALLILGDASADAAVAGEVLLWVAALLTLITAVDYVRSAFARLGAEPADGAARQMEG